MSKYQLTDKEKNPNEHWPGVLERSRKGELTETERHKAMQMYKETNDGKKYFNSLPLIWGDNNLRMGWYDEKYDVFYPNNLEEEGVSNNTKGDVEVLTSRDKLNDLFKRRGVNTTNKFYKFSEGGVNPYDSSDFNNIIMNMVGKYNSLPQQEDYLQQDEPEGDVSNYYDDPKFDELNTKMEALQEKMNSYQGQQDTEPDGDVLFDYIMGSSNQGQPIDWSSVQPPQQSSFNNVSAQGLSSIDVDIAKIESGGNYKAENPNSSAVGKYQFLWKTWGPEIARATGISTKEGFKSNPQAQEDFYSYYKNKHMLPAVMRLQKYNTQGLSEAELAKLYHFKGEGGALKWLTKGIDNTQKNNISINKYMGR